MRKDLAAFYRYKGYTILVEQWEGNDLYEGITYKHSHHNPVHVVTGEDWQGLCAELESWLDKREKE